MGIRFRCHHCEHELNLKEFQAGRRARCPACSGRFRVPTSSADFSDPLDDQEVQLAATTTAKHSATSGNTFNLRPSSSDPDVMAGRAASSGNSVGQASSAIPSTLPAAIREAPQAVWYVRPPGGEQYGPAEGYIFHGWLQDSRIGADSLVWRDGWPQWQLAGDVFAEHFGENWRVAQDSSALVDDDTIDSPIADSESNQPGSTQPVLSKVALVRRKKQQTTYGIVIGILAILAIALIVVLVSVVFK